MALTVTKSPSQVIPAKNQCDIEVTTNNVVTAAGSKALAIIQISKTPTTGFLTIANNLFSQSFTFETTPNTSGLELPRNSAALDSNVYANTILIPALLNNYYINRDYTIELNSVSPSTFMLLFTARQNGAAYTLTTNGTVASYSAILNTAGTDKAIRPNFRVFMDVFAEKNMLQNDFELVYPGEGVPDNSGKVGFDLNPILESITSYSIPPFEDAGVFFLNKMKRFYVKFCEVFGTPPTPQRYYRWPTTEGVYATAFYAAAKNNSYPFSTFGNSYFKTAMPNGSIVLHPQQKQYLTFFNTNPASEGVGYFFKITVKLYYTDGTESSWIDYQSDVIHDETPLSYSNYLTIDVGYSQLRIDTLKASGKTVERYEVKSGGVLEEDAQLETPAFGFKVEQDAQRYPRYFLFINSYGFPETVYFYGLEARSIEADTTVVQRPFISVDANNAIVHGEFAETNRTLRGTTQVTTGNKDKTHLDYFKDFIASPARYQQTQTQFVNVIMEKATIEMDKDDDTLFSLDFKFKDAMFERGIA